MHDANFVMVFMKVFIQHLAKKNNTLEPNQSIKAQVVESREYSLKARFPDLY